MSFQNKTRHAGAISIVIACSLCFGAAAPGAYAAPPSAVQNEADQQQEQIKTTDSADVATSHVIDCVSEEIIVRQGGTDFKIETDSASQTGYIIRDHRNIPMEQRYYGYDKRDVIVERKSGLDDSSMFSSTIILPIPDRLEEQSLLLVSQSGNIRVESLNNVNLTVESESGNITVDKTNAAYIYTKYSVNVNTDPKARITMNGKGRHGGGYTIGLGGEQAIALDGVPNDFTRSGLTLFHHDVTKNPDEGVELWIP